MKILKSFRCTRIGVDGFWSSLPLFVDDRIIEYLKKFKPGEELVMSVRRIPKKRSPNQNNYYWGVVIEILSNEWGWEPEEVHDYLLAKYSRSPDGRIRRSSKMSVTEFEEYAERCRRGAAFLGINIPLPNEVDMIMADDMAARNSL